MTAQPAATPNLLQAVPFFNVTDMAASIAFYVDGLGFRIAIDWAPGGVRRWCRLERDLTALMLQQFWQDGKPGGAPQGKLGAGISIAFTCTDALAIYHEITARGVTARPPSVGNGLWGVFVVDPDGYRLEFHSPTDQPEESIYSAP